MSDKYIFNPQLLRFEKKNTPLKTVLLRYSVFIIFYACSLMAFSWFTMYYWNTPREQFLLAKQKNLEERISKLKTKIDKVESDLNEIEKRDNEVYRSIFEVDPIPHDYRIKGLLGRETASDFYQFSSDNLVEIINFKITEVNKRIEVQNNSLTEIAKLARNRINLIKAIPAIQPISNAELIRFSSGFGYRTDPIYKVIKMHEGVDFTASTGTPIYATASGVVKYSGYKHNGYGRHVIIEHGYGYKTLYGHMSSINVSIGKKVKRGEIIGRVGSTGKSTAPHLHYEVVKNNKKVNPIYFFYSDLDEKQFEELLKRAQLNNQSFD